MKPTLPLPVGPAKFPKNAGQTQRPGPIRIDPDIPIPGGRRRLYGIMHEVRTALWSMKPGDSFVFTRDNKHPYQAAGQLGVRITTRKLPEGGWRVWLVSRNGHA